MKKINIIKRILIVGIILFGFSCTKLEYDKELNAKYPISGDWTITVTQGDDNYGTYFMRIYNTSLADDSVWIDDNGEFWDTKTKCKADVLNRSFATEKAFNEYYDSEVSYFNGKVINNDSIYFEVKFSDDGATENWDGDELTWIYSGHRKQSYEEYNTH